MLDETIKAIEEQQKGLKPYSAAYCVGEQLKEILRDFPAAADTVMQDLQNKGMGIADCEKKIHAFADAHKDGSCGCCPPNEAEKIIRGFYGIDGKSEGKPDTGNIISLEDLL